jgi:hypothetical protein
VVSDGAGSASHGVNGATFICDELVSQVERNLPDSPPSAQWLRDCVSRTRDGLFAEAERLEVQPRQASATLLCAVLSEHWSAFAQVGDGAIVTPEVGTETWAWLFWPQRGEYANSTLFLTDPAALDRLEVDALPHAQHEVAIFTDGLQHLVLNYEEQTVHSPFFERMMVPIRSSGADGEDRKLCFELEKYLGSPLVTSRSDDDLTLVMASRSDAGAHIGTTG